MMLNDTVFAGVELSDADFVGLVDEALAAMGELVSDGTASVEERWEGTELLMWFLARAREIEADATASADRRQLMGAVLRKFLAS